MVPLGDREPLPDEVDVLLRGRNTGRRPPLKRMEHVDRVVKTHGIDRPVRVRTIRRHDLEHGPPAKALEGLHGRVLLTPPRGAERLADVSRHGPRKGPHDSPRYA